MIKFFKDFQVGAAMSALQTEGKGTTPMGALAFDEFFQKSPELFYHQVGPEVTSDIMRHYENDIDMFAEIGLDSIRTGFSWARLFPDGKTLNQEAVTFYHNYLAEFKAKNIKIFMTLFHFDMPLWAHNKGGWSNREVIAAFVDYATFIFQEYEDEVDYYVTFNEPLVPVFGGYLGETHYPAINDPKAAVEQAFGIFLAHAKVISAFRGFKLSAPIGVVYNWNYTYAFSQDPADVEAAKIYDTYVNRGPLKIMYDGTIDPELVKTLEAYEMLPSYTAEEAAIIKATTVDFLGINYYFPCRVQAIANKNPRWALDLMDLKIPEGAKMNPHRGWEIYPEALYDIGVEIKKDFNNIPWYIAENGMGVENEDRFRDELGVIQDDYRIEFIEGHLQAIKKAIDAGSNCFGFHIWAAIDCWSFRNAYKNRYGLIEVDLKDQSRKFKKSASWFKELIKNKAK